jgi:DNA-binding GntR family transcriptional regulator
MLQLLELTNLQYDRNLDTSTIINILSFLCVNDKFRDGGTAFSLLRDIVELIRCRNLEAAEGLAKLHLRTTISRQATDRFGLSHKI